MYRFSNYNIVFSDPVPEEEMLTLCGSDGEIVDEHTVACMCDEEHISADELYHYAEELTKKFPEHDFVLDGIVDATSGAGEQMNVRIVVQDEELEATCSGWYVETSRDSYGSYDEFCDEWSGTQMSEDEFDNWGEEFICVLDSGSGSCVPPEDVPMEMFFPDDVD